MISARTITDLQDIFHATNGRRLTNEEAQATARAFLSFRDTQKAIVSRPKHLFHAAFTDATFYNKAVFPCDILELRNILETQKISSSICVSLWALLTARKIFSDYPCYVVVNFDPKKYDCFMAGGVAVFPDSSADIRGQIQGIIANGRAPFEIIEKIVAETIGFLPVYGEAYTPGIDIKKIASKEKEKKFVVNMPSMGIINVLIVAETDRDAVGRALARRWNRLPKSKEEPRPERFTAEFWQDSGFWDSIVKEASYTSFKTAQVNPTISLTPEEQQVFDTILAIDQQFGLGQQYRVAGGWVRDRLLGTQSDDIDIALDKMTGQQFLRYAEQYRINNPQSQIGKSYVVSANDAKSKHLETTALEIGPFKIDFVNLRSEDYAADSRTPEMKFGNPETDAQRRDLTINALFYNIGAQQVEDYVGGLEDLQSMTLRTPLDPVQTFMDDPLRVLRALRFYSRYDNFSLDTSIVDAMKIPAVHAAFLTKVSPERSGPEILKTFKGKNPQKALKIMYETGFDKPLLGIPNENDNNAQWAKIQPIYMAEVAQQEEQYGLQVEKWKKDEEDHFKLTGKRKNSSKPKKPPKPSISKICKRFGISEFQLLHKFDMNQRNPHHEFDVQEHTFQVMGEYAKILDEQVAAGTVTPEDRMLAMMASWFHDYGKLHPNIGKAKDNDPNHFSYREHEDKSAELAEEFMKRIGIGSNDRDFVTKIVQQHMVPHIHDGKWEDTTIGRLQSNSLIPGQDRKDVWKFIMWHGQADDAGKASVIDPQSQAEYKERFQQTQNYTAKPPAPKPYIGGVRIMELIPELDRKTGFINEVTRRLLEAQWSRTVQDAAQAEQFVMSIKPEILNMYGVQQMPSPQPPQEQPPQPPAQASNWYSKLKVAEQRTEVYDDSVEDDESVKHMLYYPPGGNSVWSVGDKVRHRRKGLAFRPVTGRVIKKDGAKIVVQWDDTKKNENFSTDSTETMAQIERV